MDANAANEASLGRLKQAILDVFKRLHAGQLRESDFVRPAEVEDFVVPAHVDYWMETRAIVEPDILPFRHLDDPDSTILDVGAHTGYTAASLRNLPLRNPICSIEPMVLYNPALGRLAELDPKYSFLNVAASDRSGKVTAFNLVVNKSLIGGTTSIDGTTFKEWFADYILTRVGEGWLPFRDTYEAKILRLDFETIRLDDLIRPGSAWPLAHRRIVGLKIDVEGHEVPAIEGAAGILKHHRPLIMVELKDIPSMVRRMRKFGYLPYEREGSRIRPLRSGHYNLYFAHESMLDAYFGLGLTTC